MPQFKRRITWNYAYSPFTTSLFAKKTKLSNFTEPYLFRAAPPPWILTLPLGYSFPSPLPRVLPPPHPQGTCYTRIWPKLNWTKQKLCICAWYVRMCICSIRNVNLSSVSQNRILFNVHVNLVYLKFVIYLYIFLVYSKYVIYLYIYFWKLKC